MLIDEATEARGALRLARRLVGSGVAAGAADGSSSTVSSNLDKAANSANMTHSTVRSEIRATPTIISKNRPSKTAINPMRSNLYVGFPDFLLRSN